MTASEAAASITSDSVTAPTARRMTLTDTSSWGSLAISSSIASSDPATSDLITRLSSWSPRLKMSSSETRLPLRRALAGQLAGAALVLDDVHVFACLRNAVESQHFDRLARQRLGDPLAEEVVHRAYPPPVRAGDQGIADLERSAADQDRHHRSATRVEP